MFIATAIVASNPRAFGLEEGLHPGPAYEFDYIPVQGMLSLEEVAELAGTDVATIEALNPELLGTHLPPSKTAYYVRIPLYSYNQFASGYSRLPIAKKAAASHHQVRNGETLGQIARRYGVSVSSLMRKNGLHSSIIRVGQNLVVPTTSYASGIELADATPVRIQFGMRSVRPISAAGTAALDSQLLLARAMERRAAELPVVEASETVQRSNSSSSTSAAPQKEENAEDAEPETRVVYRVRQGDTLIDIARKFSVTVGELRRWNNISNNLIRIGQRLTIYPKS
jgi:membrane-bound lytic murein transglycosylase D